MCLAGRRSVVPYLPHAASPCGEDESMAWRALMRRQEDDMVLNTVLTTASTCSKHVRTTTEFPLMSDRMTQFILTRPVAQRGADGKWSGLTKDMDTGGAHPRHDGTRRSGRSPAFPKAPPPWEAHRGPVCVCVGGSLGGGGGEATASHRHRQARRRCRCNHGQTQLRGSKRRAAADRRVTTDFGLKGLRHRPRER